MSIIAAGNHNRIRTLTLQHGVKIIENRNVIPAQYFQAGLTAQRVHIKNTRQLQTSGKIL